MAVTDPDLETRRRALLKAAVAGLEAALPASVPPRGGGAREPEHVLLPHLDATDTDGPLAAIADGPGGELRPTANGNRSFCSAESSALMAVNFLAPFGPRRWPSGERVVGASLAFERELRVAGVRAPLGPTLDAVSDAPTGSIAIEAKVAEPWRSAPKTEISHQYDGPAAAVSPGTAAAVAAVRGDLPGYRCIDAPQLLKHLLGVHSALNNGALHGPARLVLLFWRPTHAGAFADLFDRLEAELDDLAGRVADQPVELVSQPTCRLLDLWSSSDERQLRDHATALRPRYDIPLLPAP